MVNERVLATLCFWAALARPATLLEIHQWLVSSRTQTSSVSLGQVQVALDELILAGVVHTQFGFYLLASCPLAWCERRIEQEKETVQKYRTFLPALWWFQAVPFVRAVLASGSLALETCTSQSDWDVLVVARSGRLYTARIGLTVMAWLLGRLRTKHSVIVRDLFCLNHYVSDGALELSHRSLYVAHVLGRLVPSYDPQGYANNLWQANAWTRTLVPGADGPPPQHQLRSVRDSFLLKCVRRMGEWVLGGALGDALERFMMHMQVRRIVRGSSFGGRIQATLTEIEFHPHSHERTVVERTNEYLAHYDLQKYFIEDSGLDPR